MEWRDQGILLTVRRHAETSAVIQVFTPQHGLHAGVVTGGVSRRLTPVLQPGAQLDLTWRARLEEHIGTFRVELLSSRAAQVLAERSALACLNAVCAMLTFSLPERQAHPKLYRATLELFDGKVGVDTLLCNYLRWELLLLKELGLGLDLTRCAATGATRDLAFVSPKSGQAVSREGAGRWSDRLLPFPDPQTPASALSGLRTSGYFLHERLAKSLRNTPLPDARARLLMLFERERKEGT